ncbi:MAG TPA: hypothetical protein VIL37_16825 [Natronosporangium sp.]
MYPEYQQHRPEPPPYQPTGYQPSQYQPQQYPPDSHPQPPAGYPQQPPPGGPPEPGDLPVYLQAAVSPEAEQARANKGARDIGFGILWLVFGLCVTGWSIAYFEGVGYIVAWGPALYGIYKIIKGVLATRRSR